MTVEATAEEFEMTGFEEPTGITYEFDESFQKKIAAMILRDDVFNKRTSGLIRPEYFENVADRALAQVVLNHYERYKTTPDKVTFVQVLKTAFEKRVINEELKPFVKARFVELLSADVSDRDYVVDEVATFAKHQAVTKAIEESIYLLGKKDFGKISDKLAKALTVGSNNISDGYDFGEAIAARTEERLERAAGKRAPTGITTGRTELDKHLYHQGWGRKELAVLMGGPKAGKTTALIDFSIAAVSSPQKYNVLYCTLEVGKNIISDRMDANISDTPIFDLQGSIHTVNTAITKFAENSGKLMIHEFPSGSMTVGDASRLIEAYRARGVIFDMLVVDYADLMAPERVTDSTTENSKSVYVALRGLAFRENIAVLTATQTNREGAKSAVIKMEHVAEDFNKIRIADVVISINKTEEERAANEARLYFAASRNQASGFTIRIQTDNDKMKFIKKVIGAE